MTLLSRSFFDFDPRSRERTENHIGTHPALLAGLVDHPNIASLVHHVKETSLPNAVGRRWVCAVYCRRGEKRSVGVAMLLHALLHRHFAITGEVIHLNAAQWYRTCRGRCPGCHCWQDRQLEVVDRFVELFREE